MENIDNINEGIQRWNDGNEPVFDRFNSNTNKLSPRQNMSPQKQENNLNNFSFSERNQIK